jgi:hypothetical protein
MMLDLEWRNMRSKRWRGVVFAVVLAASATAQEPATDPSPEADDEALQGALASAESQTASESESESPAANPHHRRWTATRQLNVFLKIAQFLSPLISEAALHV